MNLILESILAATPNSLFDTLALEEGRERGGETRGKGDREGEIKRK